MQPQLTDIAERIRALREICEFTPEEMAQATGVTTEDYLACETGKSDFSFTFLYQCAEKFGVDLIELVTGENPHLSGYTLVRAGQGLPIKRRSGFTYHHLAYSFRNKLAETFLVRAPYLENEQDKPIALSYHEGQEFDYILSGSLRFVHDGHTELLHAGDSVYYDSGKGHGMIAAGGQECLFLSVVMKPGEEEQK